MILNFDTESSKKWAIWGIFIIFVCSIMLRFWGLGRFNELIFDEIYYAKFANNYLTNTKFYNAHPPLSQYLIAIGIWIGDLLPIGQDTKNDLTGSWHSTFSYRWMNALFGSLILPVVAALAYQLTRRFSYALLATLFISLDGLFLVDSRYALNNVFLIFFGLLGQLLVAIASNVWGDSRLLLMVGAGISFGASAACKWNGLWFLLGMYLLLAIAQIWKLINPQQLYPQDSDNYLVAKIATSPVESFYHQLAKIHPFTTFITLVIVPALTYGLLWIPHLIQNPQPNFWEMQSSILNYHEKVGNGTTIHPYCANWYTWPLLLRPLAYYFKQDKVTQIYYDVHAMGNPLLWWFALAAILMLLGSIFWQLITTHIRELNLTAIGVPLYIIVNYAANLLPWVKVNRCLFIYHYMGALLFAAMGLAWLVDEWLRSRSRLLRGLGLSVIFSIAIAFVFWLPIYLGLPLDSIGLSLRIWNSGIFKWI
jgi:dolichyl-phosphate-mannose-protein mannosyltransferase